MATRLIARGLLNQCILVKGETMSTRFIILNIERGLESNVSQIDCVTDKGQRQYQLKFENIGITMPGELQDVITHSLKRSKRFGQIISDFEDGININFPIDLSDV